MKKNHKIILLIVLTFLIFFAIFLTYLKISSQIENENKIPDKIEENLPKKEFTYNQNQTFLEEQQLSQIKISKINCQYDGVNSELSYTITNISDSPIFIRELEITIKNEKGEGITTFQYLIERTLNEKEEITASNMTPTDLTKAVSLEINPLIEVKNIPEKK